MSGLTKYRGLRLRGDRTVNKRAFGAEVATLRRERRLTQVALAERVGVTGAYQLGKP